MNEATTLASLIKTQENKLNEFLIKFANQKVNVDTTKLKELIDKYHKLLNQAANIKPNINTSDIEPTVLNAINDAVSISRLSDLQYEVTRQTEAITKTNTILSIGFGKMFKWWLFVLTLFVGIIIGVIINLCFAIPDKITKIEVMQRKVAIYDEALRSAERCATFVNSSAQTRYAFAKYLSIKIDKNSYLQSPLEYVNEQLK